MPLDSLVATRGVMHGAKPALEKAQKAAAKARASPKLAGSAPPEDAKPHELLIW